MTIWVASADSPIVRQRLKDLGRQQKTFAARAGNAANTAQQVGIGIGAALAVGGGVALATATAALGALVLTISGVVIALAGLLASHLFTSRRIAHEERVSRYLDAAEELKQ
ncbi:hypothetical protein [Sphingomonas bacterium]|uniref:hypothetical protein n=1 Tax=Sphingomonas bacterium TaxID=1895847 RepID=UPI00157668EA|nr:hypothetical protein [Sphingomonas bacterium]